MNNNEIKNDNENKIGFEQNIDNAQKYLEKLIDPQITLSKSVDIYKKGIKELENAQELLEKAKLEFEVL